MVDHDIHFQQADGYLVYLPYFNALCEGSVVFQLGQKRYNAFSYRRKKVSLYIVERLRGDICRSKYICGHQLIFGMIQCRRDQIRDDFLTHVLEGTEVLKELTAQKHYRHCQRMKNL